jgi:FkbM family methyltransferase
MLRSIIRQAVKNLIFRPGTVAKIRLGPLRGCRYVVGEDSGWAPIVGRWEPGAQAIYRRFVKSGDTVYDLGANTGLHSLLFSRLVGDSGQVFAFEPVPTNIDLIDSTIKLNGIRNITIIPKAISHIGGYVEFHLADNKKQGFIARVGDTGTTMKVAATSLDEFVESGAPAPSFVKIDVEGEEGQVLRGFSKTINICRPILSIELHSPDQDLAVGSFLAERNYKIFRYQSQHSNALRKMVEVKRTDLGWPHPDGVWGMILAVPSPIGIS